jgi:hypothetical protein
MAKILLFGYVILFKQIKVLMNIILGEDSDSILLVKNLGLYPLSDFSIRLSFPRSILPALLESQLQSSSLRGVLR